MTLQLNLHLNSTFGAMFYLFWSVFLFGLLGRLLSVSSDNFRFCSGTLLGSKDDSLTEWGGEGQSSLVTQGFKRDLDHVVRDFFDFFFSIAPYVSFAWLALRDFSLFCHLQEP